MKSTRQVDIAMFSRILIAVDSSEPAQRAAETGGRLAAAAGAAVRLLHVIHPIAPFILNGPPDAVTQTEEAEQLLAKLRRWLPADVAADQLVLTGLPVEQIVNAARDWEADVVVVGDHNRHVLSRFVLGGVADAVVRQAPCSVLVVRAKDRQSARAQTRGALGRTSTIAAIRESPDAEDEGSSKQ